MGPPDGGTGKDPTISTRSISPHSRRTTAVLATASLAFLTALGACSSGNDTPAPGASEPAPAATTPSPAPTPTKKPAKRVKPVVVLISVDGLNPEAITLLDKQGRVPTLRTLIAEGASTLNARTAYEQTNTLPNHTGMLTGRPIYGPTGHQLAFNNDRSGNLRTLTGGYVPGVFDPVHDAGLSTAFFAEKTKFDFLVRSWDAVDGAPDTTGKDDGRDKIDTDLIDLDADRITRSVLELLAGKAPAFTFLHVAAPDEAGHADKKDGFMGPKYLDAVAAADAELGAVFNAVRTNPDLAKRTTIIVTADHGGKGTANQVGMDHRNPEILDNYRIPFIVWGPGVPAGGDLYALNEGARKDPGTDRVTYEGPQPIRNLDATNLVLRIFGLDPLPDTTPNGLVPLKIR